MHDFVELTDFLILIVQELQSSDKSYQQPPQNVIAEVKNNSSTEFGMSICTNRYKILMILMSAKLITFITVI